MKKALLTLAIVAVFAAAGWWLAGRPGTPLGPGVEPGAQPATGRAPLRPDPMPADLPRPRTTPLDAGLTIVPGDAVVPHVGLLRIFNADARQDAQIRQARPDSAQGQPPAPVAVDLSPAALTPVTRVVQVAADGTESPVAAGVRLAASPIPLPRQLDARATAEVLMEVPLSTVPYGTTLRVYLDIPGHGLRTNNATVAQPGTGAAGGLITRGNAQHARGDWAGLLVTGDALIAAAPDESEGYWFRGLGLESTGNREGALVAYRNAARRVNVGREPPIDLYRRIRRLEQ